ARWISQRARCSERAQSRLSGIENGDAVGRAVAHARHETRLRGELEVLAFGCDVARRELAARSTRGNEARDALHRAEASLAGLERLLERRATEARRRQARGEDDGL